MPKYNDFELDLQRIAVNMPSFASGRDSTQQMAEELVASAATVCPGCDPKESNIHLIPSNKLP